MQREAALRELLSLKAGESAPSQGAKALSNNRARALAQDVRFGREGIG